MPWYHKLHWQIILGLVAGLAYGVLAASQGWGDFTDDWITPWGTIFVNALKLIAVPLVLASLVTGVASLSDLKKLSRIGGKTIAIYVATTVVAVTLGLVVVNVLKPGHRVPESMRTQLQETYAADAAGSEAAAELARERGPLQMFVDIVSDNAVVSFGDNRRMLQVVFIALFLGIGLIQLPAEKARPLLGVMESLNDVVIRLVDLIMLAAPYGVFALIAGTITSVAGDNLTQILELIGALGYYAIAVVIGLLIQTFITYPLLLRMFSPMPIVTFFKGIFPAQLLAFSSSSSAATLPVTMERCEEKLGINEEISSFVLPLGATINMDGTALYQAVAAVFIAQTLGLSLGIGAQLTIILTAVLASIGTAAVPGAGIIMLVIILEAINVPTQGIALILGVDRILDMMRTATNVTGDATLATLVAGSEGLLGAPNLDESPDRIRARPAVPTPRE